MRLMSSPPTLLGCLAVGSNCMRGRYLPCTAVASTLSLSHVVRVSGRAAFVSVHYARVTAVHRIQAVAGRSVIVGGQEFSFFVLVSDGDRE